MKKNMCVRLLFSAMFFCMALTLSTVAHSAKITPSQVFQVTEDILIQLNRLHDANFTTPDLTKTRLELPPRLPRHVIQQGLNVRSVIQVLKRVNGIEKSVIAPPTVKEVTPQDVLSVVDHILADLVDFDKTFGLAPYKKQAKLIEGKTPTDVYANLLRAEAMIIQLGIPGTIPNEVFNSAVAVSNEIELIRQAKGKTAPLDSLTPSMAKKPSDAYSLAYYALKSLQSLTKKKEYTIPKGVIMPKKIRKNITPGDVQQMLIYCLAELSSLKVTVGITTPLVLPPPTSGQTPSTVFDELSIVNAKIQSLAW